MKYIWLGTLLLITLWPTVHVYRHYEFIDPLITSLSCGWLFVGSALSLALLCKGLFDGKTYEG